MKKLNRRNFCWSKHLLGMKQVAVSRTTKRQRARVANQVAPLAIQTRINKVLNSLRKVVPAIKLQVRKMLR